MKKNIIRILTIILLISSVFMTTNTASAAVHITNFSGTTTPSTTEVPKRIHNFYSSKDTVNVKFKVNQFIKTHKVKKVHIQVQKSNGFFWSTKATKSVTSTSQISFNVSAGSGDYRILVYDAPEKTSSYDRPPFYFAKSSSYSGSVSGLE